MFIKVKDVLRIEEFKETKLIAGKDGISNIVTSAMLMEVPDIFSFVNKNSLLITTLYPIASDENAKANLIPKLVELGLSGICIKPARYIKEIPSEMLEQADELNFPILELPEDANLSTLVSSILQLSLDKHINILNFRNFVHERFINLFLKGADIKTLIDSLSEIVKLPVILVDNNLSVTHTCKSINDKNIDLSFTTKKMSNEIIVKLGDDLFDKNSYIKYAIKAGNTRFGYIFLLKGEIEDRNLIVAVEQASLLIASVFYKNYAVMEKEKSFQDAFIRDVLRGKIESHTDINKNAETFGWNMEFPQVIMVIKILIDDYEIKTSIYENIIDLNTITKILEKYMSINRNKVKIVYIDDSIVIFINTVKRNLIEVGNLLLEKLFKKYKIGIGISNVVEDIKQFENAYSEAQKSIIAASVLNKNSFVSRYSDYEIFTIIKEVKDSEVLEKYLNNKLGRIIEYDKEVSMDLLNTLKVLIEENFNMKRASEKLFIHYNTLRHRVERLKELGIKTEDGFAIGEVVLAYNIYMWLKAKDT